jgi:hypothetical protein
VALSEWPDTAPPPLDELVQGAFGDRVDPQLHRSGHLRAIVHTT